MAFSRTILALALVLVLVGSALAQGPALAPTTGSAPAFAPSLTPVAATPGPATAKAPTVASPVSAPPTTTTTPTPESPVDVGTTPTLAPAPTPEGATSGAFVHGSSWIVLAVFGGVAALFA
ncbi:hypothetical protein RND81_08G134800 [Saponaria officinalis]|uniref:Arabinogalactan-protein n=1 Tax=Saponaria officinalis TaxID=3572 RepID=A0AAW1J720_SAPOF